MSHRPSAAVRASLIVAALASAFALAAEAQPTGRPMAPPFKAGPGPDELWDVTTKMEMPGMPMAIPAQTHQVCMKKDRKPADSVPKQGSNCTMTDLKTVGTKTSYTMVCTGETPVTATGEVTHAADAYDGKMNMTITRRGQVMAMQQVYSGRKVGACTLQ